MDHGVDMVTAKYDTLNSLLSACAYNCQGNGVL